MKKRTLLGLLTILVLSIVAAFSFTACSTRVKNVNLNFIVDGQTVSTIETSGKEVVAIPNNPEKEGYTFDGWYWDKGTWQQPFTANSLLNAPISSDMSVYAHFDIVEYTITYSLDGGINANPSSYNIETPTINLSDAVKVGYAFEGWYKESSFTNKVTSIAQGSLGNIELYAKFSINQYTISFDADGGNAVDSITQDYNTAISTPTEPTKNGYTFDGWFESNAQVAYNFSTMPANNVSLKAKWTPIEYVINYDLVGGANDNNPIKYTIETETITLNDATKIGYTFDGWFDGTEKVEKIILGSIGNVELTAHWTPIEYTISYENTKSATNSNPIKFTIESDTITLVDLEKLGYTFNGWYNGTEKVSSITKGTTGNISLTADWTVNGYEITYHNVDGATNSNPDVYDVEDEPLTLLDASKAGYTFIGWYTDSKFENEIETIAVGTTGDKDIYAKWEIIEYTATFKAGNDFVKDVIFTVETANLSEPIVPNKDGYTGNWSNYTITASDIVINAIYTPITYSITYNNTKNRPNSNQLEYNIEDDTITLVNLAATGYTFDGWFYGEEQVTEIVSGTFGNIVLTAKWTAIEYSINYIYDDTKGDLPNGVTLKVKYTIEDSFDFVMLESKTIGYTFSGWYTEKIVGTGTKVNGVELGTTENMTVYGQWGADVYTITYNNVEGITNTNATSYTIESEDFTITNLSRVGYTFEGWYSDNKFVNSATTTIVKGSHGNIDLYAKWEKITYTLTYNLYGGSYISGTNPVSYTIEDNITLINPTQTGKFFVGWYTLAENGNLVKQISVGTTGNITLYARWLTFDSNGGSTVSYTPNFSASGLTKPTDPTKDYYEFVGWYFDEQLTQKYDFKRLPSASSTLYAKWDAAKYTITYILYDGTNSETNPATYTVEDNVTFSDPSKTGYTFNGWYSNAQFTSALVTGIPVGSHENVIVYANFGINQYTISFNSNGGTSVDDITQNYATNVLAPANPAKNGYSFGGWYIDSTLKNAYTFSTIPAQDITLYAKWNLVTYNITYNLDGGTNSTSNKTTYTIESTTINLANPTKTGYTFVNWYTDSSYNNAISKIDGGSFGNKELFAKWQIITYTITYAVPVNTVNNNISEYTIITPLTLLENPSLVGYTFNGWYSNSTYVDGVSNIGGGTIGNITLYGKFTANTYDVWLDGNEQASCAVSFNLNGASGTAPATQNITETNTLTYPAIPARSGYIFGGWYANSECTGEPYDFSALVGSDIILYAKWESIGSSNSININSTETVQLSGTTEKVYKFIPLVSGNVSITSTGSIDTLGTLYKDNALLRMDDDSGVDSNFLIVYNVTAGEVYDIHIRGFSSSTTGTVTLSLTGVATVQDGGYSKAGNKSKATYDEMFKLPIPESESNFKFLGWQDINGNLYTDAQGNSLIAWNKAENTTLYSKWEKMEYTVTFVTNGGTVVDAVTLEYGARLDLNKYITTRANYTFSGWYESASAPTAFSAGTMPDRNLTLYAKWSTFAIGTIKFDEDKKAVSINDSITADLFNAICLDTNGQAVQINVTVNGSLVAGETISVRLVATSGTKTKQTTIDDIKVYGMPTLSIANTDIEYVNLNGGVTAEWFGATGTDTYGNATTIKVVVAEGYNAGDLGTIIIQSIDAAENVTSQSIENIKLYGSPEITYNTDKSAVSTMDSINAVLFNATAQDSFGESINVGIEYNGISEISYSTTTEYNTTYFSADKTGYYYLYYKNSTSSKRTYMSVYCLTTESYVLTETYYTNTSYSYKSFSVTSGYKYIIQSKAYSSSYTNTFSYYLAEGTSSTANRKLFIGEGTEISVILKATDSKGNITSTTLKVSVYGLPIISEAEKTDFKVDEVVTSEKLGISAYDTYNDSLDILITVKDGNNAAGETMTYTATVRDSAGNIVSKDYTVKIYGTPEITYTRDGIKVTEDPAQKNVVVRFNLNGGVGNIPNQLITADRGLEYPTIPEKVGYVFKGWYTTSECNILFDFSKPVLNDTTIYAGWIQYVGGGFISYNGNKTISVVSKSNSEQPSHYYAFVPLVSGTISVYSSGGLSDTYGYLYDSNKNQLASDDDGGDGNNFKLTYNVTAGTLYYVRPCGYNSSGSTTVYVQGAMPSAGGFGGMGGNVLNVSAIDSFGQELEYSVELKSGSIIKGQYVVYTITATDKLGNTHSIDTAPIPVYDINDIQFSYSNMATDLIKVSSKGEEFLASATDTFGESCDITIEAAEGYQLKSGTTISLYVVATDKAGNSIKSELISGIKVYGMPTIECRRENTIDLADDPSFYFQVFDSFGQEIYFTVDVIGELISGNYVSLKVTATDDAGNTIEKVFNDYYVKASNQVLVTLHHSDETEEVIVCDKNDYSLPTRVLEGWEYRWTTGQNSTGTKYDGSNAFDVDDLTLYANFVKEVVLVPNGGTGLSNEQMLAIYGNTYSINKLTKSSYQFLGWFDAQTDGTQYVGRTGTSQFGIVEESFPDTLYAQWSRIYSISYTLNGGTQPSYGVVTSYVSCDGASLPTPTRNGYIFNGWYKESSFTNKLTSVAKDTEGNLYLYAKWTGKTYTITMDTPYGTKKQVTYGSTFTLPVPSRPSSGSGYVFLGWALGGASSSSVKIANKYSAQYKMLITKADGTSIGAYSYEEDKYVVAVFSKYGNLSSTKQGGTLEEYSRWEHTTDVISNANSCTPYNRHELILGVGTYKISWTITAGSSSNPNAIKTTMTVGGVDYTTSGSATFTITEQDRYFILNLQAQACSGGKIHISFQKTK